jgi:hypothetical protein
VKTEIMLFVKDVTASSTWYQNLLGAVSAHGGPEYEMLNDSEGELLFQLHKLEGDEHGISLSDDSSGGEEIRGAGVLCYVRVDDVHEIYKKALSMNADVSGEPTFLGQAGHTEFIVNDLDGYSLAVYSRGSIP